MGFDSLELGVGMRRWGSTACIAAVSTLRLMRGSEMGFLNFVGRAHTVLGVGSKEG